MEVVAPDLVPRAVTGPAAEIGLDVVVGRAVEDVRSHQRVRMDRELVPADPYVAVKHLVTGQVARRLVRIEAAIYDVVLSLALGADNEQDVHRPLGLELLRRCAPLANQLTDSVAQRMRTTSQECGHACAD